MGAKADEERRQHAATLAELQAARMTINSLSVHRTLLLAKVARLEREAEALREMVAAVAQGGARAVL